MDRRVEEMPNRIERQRLLPANTVLNDRYEIIMALGEGGFAITYLANDKDGKNVAVKEYFPSSFAVRENDKSGNICIFEETMEKFNKGKLRFQKEAEILSQFQHLDGIPLVYDCFEENNTTYIVMEYIEGITLLELIEGQGTLSYNELVSLLSPIIRTLIQIHKHGIIHKDISPDNIIIGMDNKARIIDFGAFGVINENNEIADGIYGKTVILKEGFAPPEQYIEGEKQGAWIDVYGMAATIYMGLTGKRPLDTVKRFHMGEAKSDEAAYKLLTSAVDDNKTGDFDASLIKPWQAQAVITGISLSVDRRYGDMSEFYEALTVPPSIEKNVTVFARSALRASINKNAVVIAVLSIMLVLALSIIVTMLIKEDDNRSMETSVDSSITVSEESVKTEQNNVDTEESITEDKRTEQEKTDNNTDTQSTNSKATESKNKNSNKIDSNKKDSNKKSSEEIINIHEDDSMEHLEIE